jgi:hypothetical protein
MKTILKTKQILFFILIMGLSTAMEAQKKKSSSRKAKTTKTSTTKSNSTAKTSSKSSGFDYHKIEAGANLHLYIYPSIEGRSTSFGVSVTGAYRITPEFLAGIKVGTQFESYYSNTEGGIFGRYYFGKVFAGLGLNVGNASYSARNVVYTDEFNYGYYNYTQTYTYAQLEGGYRIDVNDHISIEPALNVNLPISPSGQKVWFGIRAGAIYSF